MNDKNLSFSSGKAGLVLGVVLLGALTGCVAYVDRPAQGSVYENNSAVFLVQDDYVYYPSYECYYSVSRHQYAYREGNAWVARPAPRGVTVNVLLASPSVKMNFHDAPERHHAAVVQQYPKNWKPSAEKQGQPDKRNRKDDPRDQHEDNHGR
jgi:hypothetical protein